MVHNYTPSHGKESQLLLPQDSTTVITEVVLELSPSSLGEKSHSSHRSKKYSSHSSHREKKHSSQEKSHPSSMQREPMFTFQPLEVEYFHKPHRVKNVFGPLMNCPYGEQLFVGDLTDKYKPGCSYLYYNGLTSFESLNGSESFDGNRVLGPNHVNVRRKLNEAGRRCQKDHDEMVLIAGTWRSVHDRKKLLQKEDRRNARSVKMARQCSTTSTTVPDNVKINENFTHFTVEFKNGTGSSKTGSSKASKYSIDIIR